MKVWALLWWVDCPEGEWLHLVPLHSSAGLAWAHPVFLPDGTFSLASSLAPQSTARGVALPLLVLAVEFFVHQVALELGGCGTRAFPSVRTAAQACGHGILL